MLLQEPEEVKIKMTQISNLPSAQLETGGTDLGNLLQGGKAYVKFFADFSPFPATVCSAPETKTKRHDSTNKNYSNALQHCSFIFSIFY